MHPAAHPLCRHSLHRVGLGILLLKEAWLVPKELFNFWVLVAIVVNAAVANVFITFNALAARL